MRKFALIVGILAGLSLFAGRAEASLVYSLDVISSPTIGSGSQGTVTLDQISATQVNVTVELEPGVLFVNTGGPHTPFVFNLAETVLGAVVTVLDDPSLYYYSPEESPAATPYGTFTDGIAYTGPNGGGNGDAGPLVFSVTSASGITLADFVGNAGGYYFAADVLGTNGGTGSVAALGVSTVPLPAALPLFLTAVVGAAGYGARRRKAA